MVAGYDLHPALGQLGLDRATQLGGVVPGGQDALTGLQEDHLGTGEGGGDLPGELNAHGTGPHNEDAPGVLQVGVGALNTGLGDHGRGLQVLGRERVGGARGQDELVGLQAADARDLDTGPLDAQDGAVDHPATGQEVVVGNEDALGEVAVDGGAQGPGVVDEHVLLLDERDLGNGVEGLGDGNAAVAAADDGDTNHGCPLGWWGSDSGWPRAQHCDGPGTVLAPG